MNKKIIKAYWELLNLVQDYFDTGFTQEHPEVNLKIQNNKNYRSCLLKKIEQEIEECTKCPLHSGRHKPVPGEGVLDPLVMVIGEGPGAEEDKTGLPFVGRAGKYLDKWLDAVKLNEGKVSLNRKINVYITNVIKCRPPGNRDPQWNEIQACLPYLLKQIELVKPKTILTISRFAVQTLLGKSSGTSRMRGKVHDYNNIPLIATYHPSAVLRNTALRGSVWEDLKRLCGILGN
jgi:uracil-DNA glycosylase family 4